MQKNLERLKLRKIEPGPFYLKQKSFIFWNEFDTIESTYHNNLSAFQQTDVTGEKYLISLK